MISLSVRQAGIFAVEHLDELSHEQLRSELFGSFWLQKEQEEKAAYRLIGKFAYE